MLKQSRAKTLASTARNLTLQRAAEALYVPNTAVHQRLRTP